MRARIIEATRHPGDDGSENVRLVVQFLTDAGASVGIRTVDVDKGSTQAQARAAVQAAWEQLAAATVQALVGQEWQW